MLWSGLSTRTSEQKRYNYHEWKEKENGFVNEDRWVIPGP